MRTTDLVDVLRLAHRRVPAIVQDKDVGFGDSLADFVEEKFLLKTGKCFRHTSAGNTPSHRRAASPHRVHERRLSVSYQDEDVGVQTEPVDPTVQLLSDVSAGAGPRSEVRG